MKRLTRKITGRYWSDYSANDMCDKLGTLEDIEQELGIDLITLFKALKNGIWYIDDDYGIIQNEKPLVITDTSIHELDTTLYHYFEDYGKTWALTREELEK